MACAGSGPDELATRWKWATAMIEVAWGDTARYGRIEPQPADPTPEEQAETAKLEARQAELSELDDEEWTGELVSAAEAIDTRLDEIERAANPNESSPNAAQAGRFQWPVKAAGRFSRKAATPSS